MAGRKLEPFDVNGSYKAKIRGADLRRLIRVQEILKMAEMETLDANRLRLIRVAMRHQRRNMRRLFAACGCIIPQ